MSVIHMRHIRSTLEKTFQGLIDLTDRAQSSSEDQQSAFLTRSLAAYTVVLLANAQPRDAAISVTDGYGDNGIDLIYHDEGAKLLYICQSKWHHAGTKPPELGDIHKFISGVEDLVAAEFTRFNERVQDRQAEITAALDDADTKIVLAIAHTATQPLSSEAQRELNDLIAKLNDTSEMVSLEVLGQSDFHTAVSGQIKGAPIDLEVVLRHWGPVQEPHVAYYGQVDAETVAEWYLRHRNRLFTENLRNYRGSTDVNEAIQQTLETQPERFFYMNNGLTMLCAKVNRKLLHGGQRDLGIFACEGVSIVNGAQTVGSIAAAFSRHPESVKKARLLMRLFSLEDTPGSFGKEITIATNTQNRIERLDFVALDPEQQRIREELWFEGKDYVYKSGEPPPRPDKGCNVTEATVALACASREVGLAVQAKREVGKLWENIEKPPYKSIFNATVSGTRVWRSVQILRAVDAALVAEQRDRHGRERLIAVHGNRFVLHKVFSTIEDRFLVQSDVDLGPLLAEISVRVRRVLESLIGEVNRSYSNSYPASLFKNLSKCKELSRLVGA